MRLLTLALSMASICGPTPPPKAPAACPAQTVNVRLMASDRVNLTSDGEPRPIVTRVYRLKSDAKLDRVGFDQLWHDDKTVLTDDMVKMEEVQLFPGERKDLEFPRDPAVQTIVAIGLFQTPRGRTWLYAADLPTLPEPGKCTPNDCAPDDDECRIRANGNLVIPFYFDAMTVDDGTEQAADYPAVGPHQKKTETVQQKGPAR